MPTPAVNRSLYRESEGAGPRLVLVHGFTQNCWCWGALGTDLAADHEVVRVDAPGHGRSSGVRAGLADGAGLLVDAGGPGTYVGYSMGGRFCLHAALSAPATVERLVLIGATAGLDDPEARAARRLSDARLAERLETDGLDRFLDDWLSLSLFAGLPEEARFADARRTNTVHGLADSLRLAGTGTQEPLWDRLGALAMPVLVVAGEDDAKFSAEAERLTGAIGTNATMALVPGAGHAAHLENTAGFLAVLRPWLAVTSPA